MSCLQNCDFPQPDPPAIINRKGFCSLISSIIWPSTKRDILRLTTNIFVKFYILVLTLGNSILKNINATPRVMHFYMRAGPAVF